MSHFLQDLREYQRFHTRPITKLTHVFGVPAIILSIMLGLLCISKPFAWLVTIAFIIYYCYLNKTLGVITGIFLLILLYIAHWIINTAVNPWLSIVGLFLGGWALQFLGHFFEGNKPALLQNLYHAIIAPIFLTTELLFALRIPFETDTASPPQQKYPHK